MASLNRVTITGNLTADPEVKYLPSGMAVAKLRVAVNNNYKDKSGEWKEDTAFIDVDVWGRSAERVNETCKKGSKVLVDGSLREDQWEDREGNKRSKIKVRAFIAEHIGEPKGGGRGGDYAGSRSATDQGSASADSGAGAGAGPGPGGGAYPEDVDDDLPF